MRSGWLKFAFASVLLLLSLPAPAQLVWEPDLLDFGTIRETDGKAVRYFTGVNTGTSPVKIGRVRSSCGCTTAKPDTSAILPGDTVVLPVIYNPAGRPGPFDKQIWVVTSGKTYRLCIIGDVIPSEQTVASRYPESLGALRVTRKEFVFGEMPIGTRRTRRIYCYNPLRDTVVVSFGNLPEHVAGRVLPDTVPPSGLCCLSVAFTADRHSDFGTGELTLPLNIAGETVYIPATYTMIASPDYRASADFENAPCAIFGKDRLVFENYGRTKSAKQMLTIKNTGKSELRITRVAPADRAVSVDITTPLVIEPGGTATVGVAVDGSKEDGDVLNGALMLVTNDPANPNKLIRIVGKR